MRAYVYLKKLCSHNSIDIDLIKPIFKDINKNFQIEFTDSLPLNAHKNGALAITLFKRIYLLPTVKELNCFAQIALIRHEAEHILQQNNPFFYLIYIFEWVKNFILLKNYNNFSNRSYHAYRRITYEISAYSIEDKTFKWLNTQLQNYSN